MPGRADFGPELPVHDPVSYESDDADDDLFFDASCEYPSKAWLDPDGYHEDLAAAHSSCNVMQPERHSVLVNELMTEQNRCPVRPQRAAPDYPDTEFRPFDAVSQKYCPWLLFHPDGFTFSAEHGPFVSRHLLPDGASTVHLSQREIWDSICIWVEKAADDVARCTSTKFGGKLSPGERSTHRMRALLWIIPIEAFDPRAAPFTWDLRSYCENPGCEIHPIRADDERRQTGMGSANFASNIERLQADFSCVDCDTPNQMARGVHTTVFDDPNSFRGCVFGTNYPNYFDKADFAVERTLEEVEEGILDGPHLIPAFLPCRYFACNVAVQPSGKWRLTGDGGYPRDFHFRGQILAANESVKTEDTEKFTNYILPTVFTFTRNLCIAQTCADDSGLPELLAMVLLLTDWVAFYRCFVVLLKYQYSQMNVRLPGGSTVDTAMFFGDRGAPNPANHCMNWLLFIVQELLFIRLQKVSTWSVFLKKTRIPTFDPEASVGRAGTDHDSTSYGASSYTALRRAFAWDLHPKVRTWRQHRYDLAISAGLSPADSYWQSIPFVRQGYFDDGQFAIAACLLFLLIESLLELVNLVGVGLSYTKMVVSFQNDTKQSVDISAACADAGLNPASVDDLTFSTGPGTAVILGKDVLFGSHLVSETKTRVDDTIAKIDCILSEVKSRETRLTGLSGMRSIIGILMYICITKPDLRGLLNAPMRSLKVKTRLGQHRGRRGPSAAPDQLVPFSYDAGACFETVKYSLRHLEGRPFASKLDFPALNNTIFIMNDAAGLGDDDSFRGGGSWIWVPVEKLILWTTRAFSIGQLHEHHSTSLEIMNGNCTLLAALEKFPKFDVVEIYDNQSAVAALRRLACNSDSLNVHMDYRRRLLQPYLTVRRIYTLWSNRKLGTLADMLSKYKIPEFLAGLIARGFPAPLHDDFQRPDWYA